MSIPHEWTEEREPHERSQAVQPEQVSALLAEIEARDLSTAAHTWRVTLYTRALAEAYKVGPRTMESLTQGAALHDVGKLDIPIEILQKPGGLSETEFEVIKLHTVAGYARLIDLNVEDEIMLDLVRYHHERWDGLGYPFGLKGHAIPVPARFFAVIDSFDAMTSVRPYRPSVSDEAVGWAIRELRSCRGTRYWPEAVDAFCSLQESGQLDWILHHFNDSVTLPAYVPMDPAQLAAVARGQSSVD